MTMTFQYAVRGDLHARRELSHQHFRQLMRGYQGLLDVGDVEAPYIHQGHPLRAGQRPDEPTMHAIIRNSLDERGLTATARDAIEDTLRGMTEMAEHLSEWQERLPYYNKAYVGIAGNAQEVWNVILEQLAPERVQEVNQLFDAFSYDRESRIYYPTPQGLTTRVPEKPRSAVVTLPWNALVDSVLDAGTATLNHDLDRIVVLSHDYLGPASVQPDTTLPEWKNQEQFEALFEALAVHDADVIAFYGHIGGPAFETKFDYQGKTIKCHHVDEDRGELIPVELIA